MPKNPKPRARAPKKPKPVAGDEAIAFMVLAVELVRVSKAGRHVEVLVDGRRIFVANDPHPLPPFDGIR